MPYFKTSQEWLVQSILLIEARPSTTRVTTRYALRPAKTRATAPPPPPATDDAARVPPRAVLVLKTYDPVSGVALKYRTTKAAEVTRLVAAALGRLGRAMAGVGEVPEAEMGEAESADVSAVPPSGEGAAAANKKKKKGRR